MTSPDQPGRGRSAEDRRIRRAWLTFVGSFGVLGLLAIFRVWFEPTRAGWLMIGLLVVVGFAAIRHRLAVQALESGRRAEAESFARILQGLSRSISPDHIMDAIVEELGVGTGADHVVVARRRPDARVLEATLVNTRSGGPPSTTLFPITDLEDPPALAERSDASHWRCRSRWVRRRRSSRWALRARPRPRRSHPVRCRPSRSGPRRTRRRAAAPRHDRTVPRSPAPTGPTLDRRFARPRAADRASAAADRIALRARRVYGLKHTLTAPLTTDAGVIGAIVVSRRTADPWPESAHRILAGAAAEASAALARAYSHRQAEARAATDALTGLPNRRYFDEFCALLARRRRAEDGVGVLMVDIDKFKVLNDTHGHHVGDEVLRAVAAAIAGAVREDDVPARFGGEEFAVLLRNPSRDESVEVGERIRQAVRQLDLSPFGVASTSVSVGVAVADVPDEPIPAIIERADKALFEAKRAGRDRVVAA